MDGKAIHPLSAQDPMQHAPRRSAVAPVALEARVTDRAAVRHLADRVGADPGPLEGVPRERREREPTVAGPCRRERPNDFFRFARSARN